MFALYLDIQKQLYIDDLSEDEVKGRWKSFVGNWNRGALAEGWYDPKTLAKALSAASTTEEPRDRTARPHQPAHKADGDAPEDDDDYGPKLPCQGTQSISRYTPQLIDRRGPSIPTTVDLRLSREQAEEDATSSQLRAIQATRQERRLERKAQTERLDELTPPAAAGTRERQLEKKRESAAANRSFAAAKEEGGEVDLKDSDVMGDEDSLGQLKRMKQGEERKKNERELRREEVLRARQAERDERLAGMRAKEEETMGMLKEIARARFGSGVQ